MIPFNTVTLKSNTFLKMLKTLKILLEETTGQILANIFLHRVLTISEAYFQMFFWLKTREIRVKVL